MSKSVAILWVGKADLPRSGGLVYALLVYRSSLARLPWHLASQFLMVSWQESEPTECALLGLTSPTDIRGATKSGNTQILLFVFVTMIKQITRVLQRFHKIAHTCRTICKTTTIRFKMLQPLVQNCTILQQHSYLNPSGLNFRSILMAVLLSSWVPCAIHTQPLDLAIRCVACGFAPSHQHREATNSCS